MPVDGRTVLIKGGGEKASAVAHALFRAGITRLVMTETPSPTVERRSVAFCEALWQGRKMVQGVEAMLCDADPGELEAAWASRKIAVVVDPDLRLPDRLKIDCFIDAVMAKRNTGTHLGLAQLVIALGPGFVAGRDAHFVIETDPSGSRLGEVITGGSATADHGRPTEVMGLAHERLLFSPAEGRLEVRADIGRRVRAGQAVAEVAGRPVTAGIDGVVWGLVRSGTRVRKGAKVGDIDPRNDPALCRQITPQAKAIARGVLSALTLVPSSF